ncbi:MAG: hypothetical protein AAB131_00050, partial [Actinomycetota bacterium]
MTSEIVQCDGYTITRSNPSDPASHVAILARRLKWRRNDPGRRWVLSASFVLALAAASPPDGEQAVDHD